MKLSNTYRSLILSITIVCGMSFTILGQTSLLPTSDLGTDPYFMKINDQYRAQHNPLTLQLKNPDDFRNDLINQLDTVVIYGVSVITQRQMHTYSAEGNRILTYIEKLDNNLWTPYKQETATYDDENNQLSLTLENFDGTGWVNSKRTTRTFTTNHNPLTEIIEYWIDGAWENNLSVTYQYNSAGNPISVLFETWDSPEWKNSSYELFTYDDTDNLASVTGLLWTNNTWENNTRYSYTYDVNGNMLIGVSESWNSNVWVNSYKDNYAYNIANKATYYAGQVWNTGISDWGNDVMYSYEYNELDLLSNSEQKMWIDEAWENYELAEFTYTTFGSRESALIQYWNIDIYENSSLTQANYDEYGNANNVYFYNWSGSSWVLNSDEKLPLTYNFNTKKESFIGSYLWAHYSSLPVGISEVESTNKTNMHCYPNPAKEETTIFLDFPVETTATISIYSITGSKIKSITEKPYSKGTNQVTLETIDFHSGLYFVLLETVDKKLTYKLIIN